LKTYTAISGSYHCKVSLDNDGAITFGGMKVDADIEQVTPSCFSVVLNGRSLKVIVHRSASTYHVLLGSAYREFIVESERERLLRSYGQKADAPHDLLEIHAPMPALVVKVEVEVGEEVAAGQGLLVLEAMKMENELRTHQAGKVKDICVDRGDKVEKGQLLVVLE
jgi:pyruvate carboxylase subunit B